jgi:hypothetical protein
MKKTFCNLVATLLGVCVLISLSACKGGDKHEGHDHGEKAHHHHHDPPNGGTGLTLGDEDAHIELLRDAATGKMKAWILAPHMSGYTRIKQETLEITAKVGGEEKTLTFKAVANAATGETVGNTSLFEAEADWLKTTDTFDGTLKQVDIKGKIFSGVAFNFPKGN